jgi:tagatose 1,6-diphosphate aldolase
VFGRFRFLNPFPLVDRELELVAPSHLLVDGMLATLRHPLTQELEPEVAAMSRGQVLEFLAQMDGGRQPADLMLGRVPSYQFWMLWNDGSGDRPRVVGSVALRIGDTPDIVQYIGHVGYNVFPPARGHHFAERATRLILPLAKAHNVRPVWITCNPTNIASRRTIERLGATFVDVVPLPHNHLLRQRGETEKNRYRIDL